MGTCIESLFDGGIEMDNQEIQNQELKFENVDNKVDDNNCKVENFNMNQFGHLDYKDNLEEVLKIINL